ncbi:Hypothetical predicted protein [Octopus vulgaris]|uniref:Uncharacterized protein n=1 Tax=Octopus vulgaris TaxID=6645 RepID=A0AA36B3I2_OCTVU|nr:Hypothetical predicted protein [Octopus vulgaris]
MAFIKVVMALFILMNQDHHNANPLKPLTSLFLAISLERGKAILMATEMSRLLWSHLLFHFSSQSGRLNILIQLKILAFSRILLDINLPKALNVF